MKAFFVILFSIITSAVCAQSVQMPVALAHTLYYSDASGPFYNIDIYTTWKSEPVPTNTGIYAGFQFAFQNGGGGYMGTQVSAGGRKTAIFSIWDAGTTSTTALPTGADTCVRFGHEGSGTSCILDYNWVAGREYKVRIWVLNRTNGATSWGGWIQDMTTGIETQIGTILLNDSNGYQGYGWLSPGGISFTEHFGFGTVACAALPHAVVTWRGPYMNNNVVIPATIASAAFNNVTCFNSNEYTNQASTVTHEVGGSTIRTLVTGTNLWQPVAAEKLSQTIRFGGAPSILVGKTATVSASSSSGLPVTFSITTPNVCAISGSTVTGISAGICTIAANQAGNSSYAAASQETQNATVIAAQAVITSRLSAAPTTGTAPLAVKFTGTGSSTISADVLSYLWTFGDGSTSTEQSPSRTYTTAGTYSATLKVSNATSQTATSSAQTITVTAATAAITSTIIAEPERGYRDLVVKFYGAGSSSVGIEKLSYEWNFGDGTRSTAQFPEHTYTATGVYSVTLRVSNASGQSATSSAQLITVTEAPTITAQFQATPNTGNAQLTVNFTGLGSSTLSTDRLTYLWTFGDGDTSADQSPSHIYPKAGTYSVTLKVSNTTGQTVISLPQVIKVNDATGSSLPSDADKVFAWAEKTYPAFFSPGNGVSQSIPGYRFRAYSGRSFLAVNESGEPHLLYIGPLSGGGPLLDLGLLSIWLAQAGM